MALAFVDLTTVADPSEWDVVSETPGVTKVQAIGDCGNLNSKFIRSPHEYAQQWFKPGSPGLSGDTVITAVGVEVVYRATPQADRTWNVNEQTPDGWLAIMFRNKADPDCNPFADDEDPPPPSGHCCTFVGGTGPAHTVAIAQCEWHVTARAGLYPTTPGPEDLPGCINRAFTVADLDDLWVGFAQSEWDGPCFFGDPCCGLPEDDPCHDDPPEPPDPCDVFGNCYSNEECEPVCAEDIATGLTHCGPPGFAFNLYRSQIDITRAYLWIEYEDDLPYCPCCCCCFDCDEPLVEAVGDGLVKFDLPWASYESSEFAIPMENSIDDNCWDGKCTWQRTVPEGGPVTDCSLSETNVVADRWGHSIGSGFYVVGITITGGGPLPPNSGQCYYVNITGFVWPFDYDNEGGGGNSAETYICLWSINIPMHVIECDPHRAESREIFGSWAVEIAGDPGSGSIDAGVFNDPPTGFVTATTEDVLEVSC